MKKLTLLFVLALTSTFSTFAQKKVNGKVYIEHPAITVVENFTKAWENGDQEKMASYLTDDFKAYNGTSTNASSKGKDKEAFLKTSMLYFNQLDYFSVKPFPGAYPDAIDYKKDNKEKMVWVQTWDMLKGVHKTTGVKIDAAAHSLYALTKDDKIKTIINYSNSIVLNEIGKSFVNRTNGTIYNHHDNINTVRKAMYAFENLDVDKSLSFYTDDATFRDINQEYGTSNTKAEIKPLWEGFLDAFEIKSIEMIGYPDYLEYEMGNGREVLSWWNFHLVRKSDKKEISLPFHLSDSFDADGKITSEMTYYSQSLLNAK